MSHVRIVHLSDPHFGTIKEGMEEALLRTVHELTPDMVLITGDITQRARKKQFSQAKKFVKKLNPIPVIAVPGNHDIPLLNLFARLFSPYRAFKKLFKDQLERTLQVGDVQVIGLNSTSRWRHVQGDFNLERVAKRLVDLPSTKLRVAAFHHPMDCDKDVDDKNLLKGRDAAMAMFEKAEVDLIIGGHIHDPFVSLSKVRYPHHARSTVIAVAGTCLSWRIRKDAPNSFNLIDVDTEGEARMTITRFDHRKDMTYTAEAIRRFRRCPREGWVSL